MDAHLELDGSWHNCAGLIACALPYHVADLSPEEATATPLQLLLPLFEIATPPSNIYNGYEKWWRDKAGRGHRDYDLPAVIFEHPRQSGFQWQWFQHGQMHRDGGKPALIRDDGVLAWWEHGVKIREFVPEQLLRKRASS